MILTLHPDDRPCTGDKERVEIGIKNWQRARHELRALYADHRMIATLGALEVKAEPGAESYIPLVYDRLGSFIEDLGNSIPDCWMGAKHAIQNLSYMRYEPKHNALHQVFHGTTICIASGPSNAKWLPIIRELQETCTIVIADSMWKGCRAAGIDPHFVCVLERDPLLATLVPPDRLSRARLVLPATSYPPTHDGWQGKRVWWWQQYTDLYRWLAPDIPQSPTGRSAGTMAAALSVLLGSSKVYLVGHDLCRGDDGSSHSAHVDALASTNHAAAHDRQEPLHNELIIDGKRTCRFWDLARGDLETLAADNPGIMCRLGDDGLDIPGIPRERQIEVGGDTPAVIPQNLFVSPSRDPIDIKPATMVDQWHWEECAEFIEKHINGTDPYLVDGMMNLAHPRAWASQGMADIYKYVLGPAYRAASLRAFLRNDIASAFRILNRAIPATLRMMERES